MTFAQAPDRPRASRRPLWIAAAVAALTLLVLAWAMLDARSRPSSESRGRSGSLAASTPAQDAAQAVDATPLAEAAGPGAFGGPGSAADGSSIGPLQVGEQVVAQRSRPRPRRASRPAQASAPSQAPSYRTIGPEASVATDPAPAPPPPPPQT